MIDSLAVAQMYWKKEDPKEVTYFLIGLGGILLFTLLYQLIKNGVGGGSGGSGTPAGPSYSASKFKRAARSAGLSDEEARFLEEYGKAFSVVNPEFLFANRQKFESFLKDVYRSIEKNSESEAVADEKKVLLFTIQERLAKRDAPGKALRSTRQLGRAMPLSFITPNEESYPTIIVESEAAGLSVEPVRDPYGEPIRFKRGTKLTCFFYTQGHQGYQFVSKVAGWDKSGAAELMVIAHSDDIQALPSRRHQRKEMRAPCRFYRVQVSPQGKGQAKTKATVENAAYPGTITDISAGGAGIQCGNPLQAGEFLKIEFDAGTGVQSAFGKVVRMNKARTGGIMHVQFVKISRKSLNAVLSYVHGYVE